MAAPYVSAIIPVYNQERYLGSAIDSVLGQSFRDTEVLVVDDGSTDRTPEIIAAYGSRVRRFRKPNGGGASALNLGIREARGTWIAWLSSDDLWEPTKLERQVAAVRSQPDAAFSYTDAYVIDSDGRIVERQYLPNPKGRRARMLLLARGCFINGIGVLIRKDVFEAVGLFDEADRLTYDYDLWFRIAPRYEFLHVPEPLVRYRVHPGQASKNLAAMERSRKRVISRALRRYGSVYGTLALALRLRDALVDLPWHVSPRGRRATVWSRVMAAGDSLKALVNPGSP
ncbi:MAG TPA: glycosyltransferase [Thermoplasmata archaeon]|nr:glycosyltransferase [Thermoplasmata archaeon]